VFAPIQKVEKLNEAAEELKRRLYSNVKPVASALAKPTVTLNALSKTSKILSTSQESLNSMKSERSSLYSASAAQQRPTGLISKPKLTTTLAVRRLSDRIELFFSTGDSFRMKKSK
jgi:hypothetical protein